MCGIFGFYFSEDSKCSSKDIQKITEDLLRLSESRGRDAAGVVLANDNTIVTSKKYLTASQYIKSEDFKSLFSDETFFAETPIRCIGHTRLATNGATFLEQNNQPVLADHLIGVHNGIITNDELLWGQNKTLIRELEVDTELMLKMFKKHTLSEENFCQGVAGAFQIFEGNVSCAVLSSSFNEMILATNNGSIYVCHADNKFFFASERLILELFLKSIYLDSFSVTQLRSGHIAKVFTTKDRVVYNSCSFENAETLKVKPKDQRSVVHDIQQKVYERRENLRRCTRCILPETFPFIKFDNSGVCNICRNYEKVQVKGKEQAIHDTRNIKDGLKGSNADCLFMLSGGRDSCYALHYIVNELGLKPIAYTFDWGMVTDIARRNAERMCGKLGVEHIIVSADIKVKRNNIRKNILAWLKKPELGMVPILMAGDKQFLYYGIKIREINNLPISVLSACPFEKTGFKTGFAGVDEGAGFIYNIPLKKKTKIFWYYAKQYLTNVSYINSSLYDTLHAFWSAYFMKHEFFHTFDYEYWDEEKVVSTLVNEYNWELDPEACTSWRIGDGTAALYNYIYYTMAGFTENDTFRSHQIREGVLDRETALKLVKKENEPRWDSLVWYASVVGFNLSDAINTINSAKKLY